MGLNVLLVSVRLPLQGQGLNLFNTTADQAIVCLNIYSMLRDNIAFDLVIYIDDIQTRVLSPDLIINFPLISFCHSFILLFSYSLFISSFYSSPSFTSVTMSQEWQNNLLYCSPCDSCLLSTFLPCISTFPSSYPANVS